MPQRKARIHELFRQAVGLDLPARAEFLRRECGEDAELMREIERLLGEHGQRTRRTTVADGDAAGQSRATVGMHETPHPSKVVAHRTFLRALTHATGGLASRLFGTTRRQLVTAAVVVLMLGALAAWAHWHLRASLQTLLAGQLETVLKADVQALTHWLERQQERARQWAADPAVAEAAVGLAGREQPGGTPAEDLLLGEESAAIRALEIGDKRFGIVSRSGLILAASDEQRVGTFLKPEEIGDLARVFDGESCLSRPRPPGSLADEQTIRERAPVIWSCAPVLNAGEASEPIVAALVLVQRADTEFREILAIAQMGESGETYAFDDRGLLLSGSRFPDDLVIAGLLESPDQSAALRVQVRDPGGDLTQGFKPSGQPGSWPLTRAALAATAKEDGVDLDGYRDYRGVEVIGAWMWLDDYGFGVATEVDAAEAYAALAPPLTAFWFRFAILSLCVVGLLAAGRHIVRLQRQVASSTQFGQYTLEHKLGEGGIGEVYKARHAMLRRPTAIKVLQPGRINRQSLARFEREVQLASLLSHPNTIEIYDFGRTHDGSFYYAMEYLDGLTLTDLIELTGPLPAARVIHIARQVCGSLREAHAMGLIHRDIKPPNIMLGERGGIYDFVKVLDFGLVKHVDTAEAAQLTQPSAITGTPMYMAPERLQAGPPVDARSDIYSLGVVMFNLLTGRELFDFQSNLAIVQSVLNTPAPRPSERVSAPIPKALDQLVFDCLAKKPEQRPSGARAVLAVLDSLTSVPPWTEQDAREWWARHADRLNRASAPLNAEYGDGSPRERRDVAATESSSSADEAATIHVGRADAAHLRRDAHRI